MNRSRLFLKITLPVRHLYHRESTVTGRLRLTLLLFCYIPVMVLGVAANFLGLTEPSAPFFNYTHSVLVVAAAVFLILFCKYKIRVAACLAAMTIIGQAVVSVEMLYCALQPGDYYAMLIMANMVLLAMNTVVAIAAHLKHTAIGLGAASICTYVACAVITGDGHLESFIPVFLIAFIFISVSGLWVSKAIDRIETENTRMRRGEEELLHLLRMRKDEVMAYFSLASKKYSGDGTHMLLECLSKRSRHNLLSNVENYIRVRATDMERIKEVFPEFTRSEREICQLILQGKRLTELCTVLGKTESNINSQRAHMRKKLGLRPADDLQEALQRRLDGAPA